MIKFIIILLLKDHFDSTMYLVHHFKIKRSRNIQSEELTKRNLSSMNFLNVDETNKALEPYDSGSDLSQLYANGIM